MPATTSLRPRRTTRRRSVATSARTFGRASSGRSPPSTSFLVRPTEQGRTFMTKQHDEIAWIPMRTEDGRSWFWHPGIADLQRDARKNFVKHCCVEWSELRKEGWSIVRVRLTTALHQ